MSLQSPSLSPRHLLLFVIRPTLSRIAGPDAPLAGAAAEELVLGTMAHESQLRALDQITSGNDVTLGPAMGPAQMEPRTHDDIWSNFLAHRPALAERVRSTRAMWPDPSSQLATNLAYAVAMCRVHYRRCPAPLPAAGDLGAQAEYWKRWYNTTAGAGTPEQYISDWRRLVAPYL